MNNNEIIEIVYNERYVDAIIKSIYNKYHLTKDISDDLKSYVFLLLLEYDNDLLNRAYMNGYLMNLVGKIIMNSLSKTSPFSKIMNGGFPTTYKLEKIYNNFDIQEVEYDYEADKDYEDKINKIEDILNNTHYYYSTLFRLYLKGYSYKQIEELTDIKYCSVRAAIVKTIEDIKNKI